MNALRNLACGGAALATVAVAGGLISSPAQAFECSNFTQVTGYAGRNPPIRATVTAISGV
jgi:hypothetical protein